MHNIRSKPLVLATVLALGLGIGNASAGPDDKPGSGPNPFVDCGIGAALFPDTHWAAVISNVIWDLGTTAVLSATLSPSTCSGKNVKAALFIRDTYAELAEDTARGEGEHLRTALTLFECGSARHSEATVAIRAAMGEQLVAPGFDDKTHLQKSADFYDVINAAVQTHCVG